MYAGALVEIKGTNTSIRLPADLPEGTTLQVFSVNFASEEHALAGEIYDFVFNFPVGFEDYVGDFMLTLGIDMEAENPAIYHYDEVANTWKRIVGKLNKDNITQIVQHFPVYGVLVEKPGEPIDLRKLIESGDSEIQVIPKTATN